MKKEDTKWKPKIITDEMKAGHYFVKDTATGMFLHPIPGYGNFTFKKDLVGACMWPKEAAYEAIKMLEAGNNFTSVIISAETLLK